MGTKFYKIILVGSLTYTVGRYKFIKGKEVKTSDPELLKHINGDPKFDIVELGEVEEPKAEVKAKAPTPAAPEGAAHAVPKGAVGKAVAAAKSALSPKKNQSASAK